MVRRNSCIVLLFSPDAILNGAPTSMHNDINRINLVLLVKRFTKSVAIAFCSTIGSESERDYSHPLSDDGSRNSQSVHI